jgi:flagellar motor switch protein FliG
MPQEPQSQDGALPGAGLIERPMKAPPRLVPTRGKSAKGKEEKPEPKAEQKLDAMAKLTGPQKAAIVFLCLDDEQGASIMKDLDGVSLRKLTRAMANLGTVTVGAIEGVITDFSNSMNGNGNVVGSLRVAERMLRAFLPEDQVAAILNDLRGPVREHDIWQRLSAVPESTIANYIKDEHDQTAAAILSNLSADVAARVLPMLGHDRMESVLERMIRLDAILPVTLQQIEQTLQADIMSGGGRPNSAGEIQQRMASLFNKLDRGLFEDLAPRLEARMPEEFSAIRQKMFTFNDMIKLDLRSLAIVMQGVDGTILPTALRGASKELREHFLNALPSRARDMLIEEMNTMGKVRGRDVSNAQSAIVDYARELAENETIFLPTGDEGDQMV